MIGATLHAVVVLTGSLIWACGGSAEPLPGPPPQAPAVSRRLVVSFRSVIPGQTPCGTAILAGRSRSVCAGDTLVLSDVSGPLVLEVGDSTLQRYVERVAADTTSTLWLLGRERREQLEYLKELVNVSGSRPFPFGFVAARVPVELDGLDSAQASAFRDVVAALDADLAPLVGGPYLQIVDESLEHGLRAFTTDLTDIPGRSFAEVFDEGHKIVCRIELDRDLPEGPALSSRIAHETGHCLGLTRHDPDDRTDRIMSREAPAEYWIASNGLNEFDAGVFALSILASRNEIDLNNFR